MKITGGEACGRSIDIPAHPGVRPTGSLMREALFNILGKLIENAHFLDLFAGSGLMGFEALSRGASFLTVVEKTVICVETIKSNAIKLGYENKTKIIHTDFRKAINSLNADQFNIIFADPPYMSDHCKLVTKLIAEKKLLKVDGLLIVEHSKDMSVETADRDLRFIECRPYGQSAFSFFVQREPHMPRENTEDRGSRDLIGEPKAFREPQEIGGFKSAQENRSRDNRGSRRPQQISGSKDPRSLDGNKDSGKRREEGKARNVRDPKDPRTLRGNKVPRGIRYNKNPKGLEEKI